MTDNGSGGVNIVTTTPASTTNYDGVEDQYVGVLNLSSVEVQNINLTGSSIFGLDFDGAFGGGTSCISGGGAPPFPCGTGGGLEGYPGPGTSFIIATSDSGQVDFTGFGGPKGGLKTGELGLFSLEEPASLNGITIGGINQPPPTVPEPGTMLLLGSGLATLYSRYRRRRKA
jgi:hypothetical protein